MTLARLAFICFLLASCDPQKESMVVSETALNTLGFETTASDRPQQTEWAEKQYGKAVITTQSIKARQGKDGLYPRYTLYRETYESSQKAETRLPRIQECDPTLPDETQNQKASVWNTGFVDGTSVVYLTTDADAFAYDAIMTLRKQLEDLCRATGGKPR